MHNPYQMSNKQRQGVTTAVQIMKRTEQIHSLTVALRQYHDLAIHQRLYYSVGKSFRGSIGSVALGVPPRTRFEVKQRLHMALGRACSFVAFGDVARKRPPR